MALPPKGCAARLDDRPQVSSRDVEAGFGEHGLHARPFDLEPQPRRRSKPHHQGEGREGRPKDVERRPDGPRRARATGEAGDHGQDNRDADQGQRPHVEGRLGVDGPKAADREDDEEREEGDPRPRYPGKEPTHVTSGRAARREVEGYLASAASIASFSSFASGVTLLEKNCTTLPSLPTTYFAKFQVGTSPPLVRNP